MAKSTKSESKTKNGKKKSGLSKVKKEDVPLLPKMVAVTKTSEEDAFPRSTKTKKEVKTIAAVTDTPDTEKSGILTQITVNDLTPGTLVVGVITDVFNDEIEVDLPFHLTGSIAKDQASEPGIKMGRSDQWACLKKRFRRGQLVVAVVVDNEGLRLQLTLRPSVVNAGLHITNIAPRMWLPCSVKSFEDFGCSVDLGIGDVNVYVTRPKIEDAQQLRLWRLLRPGSIFEVAVVDVNIASRTVTCSMNPDDSILPISSPIDRILIRAGFLVDVKVTKVVSNSKSNKSSAPPRALVASFCRVLSTTIIGLHSTRSIDKSDGSSVPKGDITTVNVGDKHLARIVLQIPSRDLTFSSCLEHITSWTGPLSSGQGYTVLRCGPGTRLRDCRVAAVDPQVAARLACSFNGNPIMADVARSRCLDSTPDKIPLQVGAVIPEARVLSTNMFEMSVSVTTAPAMLEEPLLVVGDLRPGQVVTAEISFISESTIFLKLSKYVTGRCPKDQATDVPVAELPPKFQVGKMLKCRVLYIDSRSNAPYLTAKKTLVEDENALVDFSVDCVVGKIVNGVVQKVVNAPVIQVRFFGGITGTIQSDEFEKFKQESKLKKGAVVRCQIVEADHLSRQLKLSLDLSSKLAKGRSPLAICSEVMQSLGILRRDRRCAVSLTEVSAWLKESISERTASRISPIVNWDDESAYIFLPRELRTFTTPGAIVEKIQVVDVSDDFISVLFIVKNIKSESHDHDDDDDDEEDVPTAHQGTALTVGVIPLNHLSDDLKSIPALYNKLKLALKTDGFVSLENISSSFRKAVLLSAYSPLDSSGISNRVCLPVLSFKHSMVKAAEDSKFIKSIPDLNAAEMTSLPGYVVKTILSGVLVSMGSLHIRGYVPAKFASSQVIPDLSKAFPCGLSVTCKIISTLSGVAVDPTSNFSPCIVDLRSSGQSAASETMTSRSSGQSAASDIMTRSDPRIVRALELIESKTDSMPRSIQDLEVGKDYPAAIRLSGKAGVFVMLSRSVEARIALNELTGSFIHPEQVATQFPVGRVLSAVRVLGIGTKKNGSPGVNVSFIKAGNMTLRHEDITKGVILGAVVKAKVSHALILMIENSDLEASCYYKHVTDDVKPDKDTVLNLFKIGDRVAARVLDVPSNCQRVNVSLQSSLFDDEEEIVTLQEQLEQRMKTRPSYTQIDGESDDDNLTGTDSNSDGEEQKVEEEEEVIEEIKIEEEVIEEEKTEPISPKKRLATKEVTEKPKKRAKITEVQTKQKKKKTLNLDTDSSECESDSEVQNSEKKKSKRQSTAAKRRQEMALREKEIDAAEQDDGLVAETPEDFERLILTEGDSAAVWIRYMAYYLRMKDPEKARGVADRGVRRISTKEDQERLNLWIAFLNFEAEFGTSQTLENTIKRALLYNDPKKVLMQLTYLHQKRREFELCIEACRTCVRKYPESKKMWVRYLTCLFEQDDLNADLSSVVRDVVVQAMRRLPLRKHIAVVLAVGRLEFKLGSPERGRTYFEKLISEHPKRTDVWGQYLDALICAHKEGKISESLIREIFEKAIGNRSFKPRQMKYLFTRWLTFERSVGSSQGELDVQQKARNYVENL